MGKVYDKVMDSRKELTQRLLAEMEQGELLWTKGWKVKESAHIIR